MRRFLAAAAAALLLLAPSASHPAPTFTMFANVDTLKTTSSAEPPSNNAHPVAVPQSCFDNNNRPFEVDAALWETADCVTQHNPDSIPTIVCSSPTGCTWSCLIS